jgi:hypothetical protein
MKNLDKRHYIITGIWFLANLLQAIFTGLHSDESYYWMYSQNLDWGFFDHPPMVALFIYIGKTILPGEIGVRLFFILISTLTFALILNELNEKKDLLFVSLFVLSFPLIHTHIAGFMAIPDVPLLFFTTLFVIVYKKYLENPNWKISIFIAFILAAMIYSKYHAFLIIGFTLLSNLNLLKSKYFYGIMVITGLLLVPHVLWQVHNEFPTFKYHLVERAKPFQFKYILPYIGGQLALAGPITGFFILWKLLKFKVKNQFHRTLIFNIVGFYAALFIISFKNRIEAHWIAATIPMLMWITYPLISNDTKIKLWFKRIAFPVILLMFLYRFYIAIDAIPNIGNLKITFYNREASALEIKEKAQGQKVGFFDNYAATSNYIFYTGDPAIHLSSPTYRFCQYDLWDDEKYADGDPLFTVQPRNDKSPNLVKTVTGQLRVFEKITEYQSLTGLTIHLEKIEATNDSVMFVFNLTNNKEISVFTDHVSEPVLAFMQDKKEIISFPLTNESYNNIISPQASVFLQVTIEKSKFLNNHPVNIYTRSKENYRGEVITIKTDFL